MTRTQYDTALFQFTAKFANCTWKSENANEWWDYLKDLDIEIFSRAIKIASQVETLPYNYNLGFAIRKLSSQIAREIRDEAESNNRQQLPMGESEQVENDEARAEHSEWNRKLKAKMRGER